MTCNTFLLLTLIYNYAIILIIFEKYIMTCYLNAIFYQYLQSDRSIFWINVRLNGLSFKINIILLKVLNITSLRKMHTLHVYPFENRALETDKESEMVPKMKGSVWEKSNFSRKSGIGDFPTHRFLQSHWSWRRSFFGHAHKGHEFCFRYQYIYLPILKEDNAKYFLVKNIFAFLRSAILNKVNKHNSRDLIESSMVWWNL